MKAEQLHWQPDIGWSASPDNEFSEKSQLVMVFGSRSALENKILFDQITEFYPKASLAGCSTSGEILDAEFLNGSLIVTAIIFEDTRIQVIQADIESPDQSQATGEAMSQSIEKKDLIHLMVFADGLRVNGTQLISGLQKHLPSGIPITGGLAGDGEEFTKTLVCSDGPPREGQVVGVGFYGSRIKIGYGSVAGWVPFGPERLITRSEGNILYEMDGQPAIDLYRSILQEESSELSAARFFFPLEIWNDDKDPRIVRTIVGIDERKNSLMFAGDVPEGYRARLMKVNFNRLMEGAAEAGKASVIPGIESPDLAILVSCVGRQIVLKQRTFQELEAVRDILGASTPMTGFYSYGELAPISDGNRCYLHNETMTITTFSEN